MKTFMLSCIKHACFHEFSPFSACFSSHDVIACSHSNPLCQQHTKGVLLQRVPSHCSSSPSPGRGSAVGRGRASRRGSRRMAGAGKGEEEVSGGLKSRTEILRKRKKREFQEGRKKMKAGKKKAGPSKGSGSGRGKNKRR